MGSADRSEEWSGNRSPVSPAANRRSHTFEGRGSCRYTCAFACRLHRSADSTSSQFKQGVRRDVGWQWRTKQFGFISEPRDDRLNGLQIALHLTTNRKRPIIRYPPHNTPTLSIRSCLNPIVTTPPPLGVNDMHPIPNRCPPASSLTTAPVARLHTVADGWCPRSPTASMPPSLENARQLTALLARKYL